MMNLKYIHKMMKETVEKYGFETMERPDPFYHPHVIGIHDEQTMFLPTNDKTKKQWQHPFIAFTFQEVILYERKDERTHNIQRLNYQSVQELVEFFHQYAKVKAHWNEETYEKAKTYLRERYHALIMEENPSYVKLMLPYNHTTSKEQYLAVYETAVAHEVWLGSDFTGRKVTIRTEYYRNMDEFLDAIQFFYEPKNIWTK